MRKENKQISVTMTLWLSGSSFYCEPIRQCDLTSVESNMRSAIGWLKETGEVYHRFLHKPWELWLTLADHIGDYILDTPYSFGHKIVMTEHGPELQYCKEIPTGLTRIPLYLGSCFNNDEFHLPWCEIAYSDLEQAYRAQETIPLELLCEKCDHAIMEKSRVCEKTKLDGKYIGWKVRDEVLFSESPIAETRIYQLPKVYDCCKILKVTTIPDNLHYTISEDERSVEFDLPTDKVKHFHALVEFFGYYQCRMIRPTDLE